MLNSIVVRSERRGVLCLIGVAVVLAGCSGAAAPHGSAEPRSKAAASIRPLAPSVQLDDCQCVGNGPGNVPVTVVCGDIACGSDYVTYACGENGWTWIGEACGDCHCSGSGPDNVPVTADCGHSACGSDYYYWACSVSGRA